MILLDGNVRALKLFKALSDVGFTFTFERHAEILRISERVQQLIDDGCALIGRLPAGQPVVAW